MKIHSAAMWLRPVVFYLAIGFLSAWPPGSAYGQDRGESSIAARDLYKAATGPHTTASLRTLELKRPTTDDPLIVRITYPKAARIRAEKFPLIVFSHGALGSKDGYQPLVEHWASHGYVCVQPTHGDSLSKLSLREKLRIGSLKDQLAKVTSADNWRTRPLDVRLILDSIEEIEKNVPALKGRIASDRVGVGGHSFGAHTSMMVAGLELTHQTTGRRASWPDPRPKVFVWISPQGTGKAMDAASWKSISRPVLVITGTRDTSPQHGKGHEWRREAFDHLPKGQARFVLIKDAYHGFGGIVGRVRFPGSGPASEKHVALVRSASLAMWDAQLKNNRDAAAFLAVTRFHNAVRGSAVLEAK